MDELGAQEFGSHVIGGQFLGSGAVSVSLWLSNIWAYPEAFRSSQAVQVGTWKTLS